MTNPAMDHLDAIGHRVAGALRVLLGLDFDSTLAAIANQPESVTLSVEMRDVLHRLANGSQISVAVISGRTLEDVRQRIAIESIHYAGDHGMEIDGPAVKWNDPVAVACVDRLSEIIERLENTLATIDGARVERKRFTAIVHYRHVAPADVPRLTKLVIAVLRQMGASIFKLSSGLKVWESRPCTASSKGLAMRQISPQPTLAMFLGDDVTDEDAFQEIAGHVTIKVGPQRPTVAEFGLDDTGHVMQVLNWLAGLVPSTCCQRNQHELK